MTSELYIQSANRRFRAWSFLFERNFEGRIPLPRAAKTRQNMSTNEPAMVFLFELFFCFSVGVASHLHIAGQLGWVSDFASVASTTSGGLWLCGFLTSCFFKESLKRIFPVTQSFLLRLFGRPWQQTMELKKLSPQQSLLLGMFGILPAIFEWKNTSTTRNPSTRSTKKHWKVSSVSKPSATIMEI